MPKLTIFGEKDGQPLVSATLTGRNSRIKILSLGAITQDWRHDVAGRTLPMVLGYKNPLDYLTNPYWFGAIAGRVANRTAYGRFRLRGQEYRLPINAPPHHIHGGPEGMHRWNFALSSNTADNSVTLTHVSPDGHMGYPGSVTFTIKITLTGDCLTYDMGALPDSPTPINLAQHSYYNLSGVMACRDHVLWLNSAAHTPMDATGLPTGQIKASAGTRYDFATPRTLNMADPKHQGYDVNVLADPSSDPDAPLATLSAGSRQLRLSSDQPGLQVYDAMHLDRVTGGHDGRVYERFAGLALEPQALPNIMNTPDFASIVCTPDQPYRQVTSVEITSG